MYLDDVPYKPSVHTGHWCGTCRYGRNGFDNTECPGCHGTPDKPHWAKRGYGGSDYQTESRRPARTRYRFYSAKINAALIR